MMKTRRILGMTMAMAMALSSMVTMTSFADESASVESNEKKETGYTQTDLDVTVDAKVIGSLDPNLNKVDGSDIEKTIPLNTVDNEGSTPTIYVEVEWDELSFVFNYGEVEKYEWDTKELKYNPTKIVNRGWDKETADITFTSYSNRPVFCGCYFEKNPETDIYDNVAVSFTDELALESAVETGSPQDGKITMSIAGEPKDWDDMENVPNLGNLKFYLSEEARHNKPAEPPKNEEPETSGEHEHHYVYDQFGRLVCTGCNAVEHEYCIDLDEDGLCDECGLERDFCEDCHVGGRCLCT